MSAIETCRTVALGGHIEGCEDCGHRRIAYNSCRNRHCPKCQGAAAREWLAAREADLLPIGYFHVVFTLPAEVADIAAQNKAVLYDLLFRAASQTMLTIAADPRHLGARIGITAVLHTWGSALTHHPHIHMIVPGGGISLDGQRWVSSRPAFLLPVRVLGSLFRRLFLTRLLELHTAGKLQFFGKQAELADPTAFRQSVALVRKKTWVVYAKPPFPGPAAVLAYLSRYTHRVAISNRRLIALDETGVTFRFKDYRRDGAERYGTMTLATGEFIRRFLLHVLPRGFHRIRHYGLLARGGRRDSLARPRELLAAPPPPAEPNATVEPSDYRPPCPCFGGHMIVIETFCAAPSRGHHLDHRNQPGKRPRDPARPDPPTNRSPTAVGDTACPDAARAVRNATDPDQRRPAFGMRNTQTRVHARSERMMQPRGPTAPASSKP